MCCIILNLNEKQRPRSCSRRKDGVDEKIECGSRRDATAHRRDACAAAVEPVTEKLGETVSRHAKSQKSKRTAWQAAAAGYLSTEHRDDPSGGCPFAALGEELARGDDNTRAAATKGFQKLVDFLAEQLRETRPTLAKRRALVALSAMVGAMTMSRMVTDPELSAAILRETKAYLAD